MIFARTRIAFHNPQVIITGFLLGRIRPFSLCAAAVKKRKKAQRIEPGNEDMHDTSHWQ
jgi:hypothetical protein